MEVIRKFFAAIFRRATTRLDPPLSLWDCCVTRGGPLVTLNAGRDTLVRLDADEARRLACWLDDAASAAIAAELVDPSAETVGPG